MRDAGRRRCVLLGLFSLYVIAGFSGYGTDGDTYLMLRSGQRILTYFEYQPSRFQGSLIPELIFGATSLAGTFYLTNLVSAVLGTATLGMLLSFARRILPATLAEIAILTIGLNPYYFVAASSSMDYVFSLFFVLAGARELDRGRSLRAAPLFACALSSRLADGLLVGGIYLCFVAVAWGVGRSPLLRLLASGILAVLLTAILYIPVYLAAGHTLGFLGYASGHWNFFGHLSRFLYKNVYLFGLLPFLWLAIASFWRNTMTLTAGPRKPWMIGGLGLVFLHEGLFFAVPLEISYLLPVLLIALPLWTALVRSKKLTTVLLALTISYDLVNVDLLDRRYTPDGNEAVGADVGVFLRPGVLLDDLMRRGRVQAEICSRLGIGACPGSER